MRGRAIPYSAEELAFIRSVSTWPRAAAHAAFCARFGRDDVTITNLHSLCKRKGWLTGRSGCFARGGTPHNKGKPFPARGRSGETQFKKGARSGRAEALHQPIGTECLTKDGYLQRKVHDDLPMHTRWQLVQRIEWEKVNGPLPDGQALKCLDGNRLNTDPSNWEPVPRGVLARLNGGRFKTTLAYDDAEPKVKPSVMALAKLRHAIHERTKGDAA